MGSAASSPQQHRASSTADAAVEQGLDWKEVPPKLALTMSRVVRLLGRTKAYFIECKQSIAPMPNPDWYEEKKDTLVNFRNLRKLPLSVHAEVWKTAWEWYKSSFEDSFAWGKRRKEEAKKNEAQAKMDVLQGMVKDAREATHNSPEDLDKTKQALKELLQEIHRSAAGSSAAGRTDNSPDFARGGWSRNREEPLEKRSKLTPFVQAPLVKSGKVSVRPAALDPPPEPSNAAPGVAPLTPEEAPLVARATLPLLVCVTKFHGAA
eukprot:jgi/Undpi1/10421/HiC_scaffold_29.g12871.m1